MRLLFAILAFALLTPAAAQAVTIEPGLGDAHDAISGLHEGDHSEWVLHKKVRRMKRRATSRHDLPPVDAEPQPNQTAPVPEPSAGLVFAAGALIAASRLRRRR